MTTLSECRWRFPEPDGLATCDSPKVRTKGAFDPQQICTGCSLANHPPLDYRFACLHRGEEVRRVVCKTCSRRVELKVFACAIHGECTLEKRCDEVKAVCHVCPDKFDAVTVPQPPAITLLPRSTRAVVTIATGDEAKRLLAVSEPYMRHFAARVGADFHVLDWPGHPAWPMSAKFGIARVLDHYERVAYVDADVLLRPHCLNLFDLCEPDEFGAVDELPFHRAQPQHRREQSYLLFRKRMGFAGVPLPWYLNCGVMVIPRTCKRLLLPPERPMPKDHCAEQDHTNAQVLDAYLRHEIRVRLLDRRANWQSWQDWGFKAAPKDACLHWSGG